MDIRGTTVIVTGAGSGIGRAIARRLAHEGAPTVVDDVNEDDGRETVHLIEAAGGRAAFIRADVASEADVKAMIAFAEAMFGPLDILVNNAGVVEALSTQRTAFPDIEPERWLRMLDVNLRGVLLGTHYAIDVMRDRGGAIVNISSGAGIGFKPHGAPVYAASKAGVARFTAALGDLGERLNIRVNCICPGWVDTPMSQRGRAEMSAEERAASVPPVILPPEEIADAVEVEPKFDFVACTQEMSYRRAVDFEQFQPMRTSRLGREIVTLLDGRRQHLLVFPLAPDVSVEPLERNRRLQQTFAQLVMVAKRDDEILLLIVRRDRLRPKEVQGDELIALRKITESKGLRVALS